MTEQAENYSDIQIPGYTLDKLIGTGGYGEVWLAQAPGGLTKAVKLIFGFHNEKRASSELRSLEKIKSVRHPFLLSLERIEVVEGRLVIVTELADGSLKDCFDQSLKNGLPGIPREELLGYLRDSADALDYLCEKHSLQHLDVKPENLLLLAGHIKVADFGLVKEIQETQASLVGGMTPLYSAPEVFQGRPTIFSDQYSLAVLYQEMLTGSLPFGGTTAAELTLQHMHDEPDLSPLPLSDRYVVARALSKDPLQRYPSCKEFVQALLNVEEAGDTQQDIWTSKTPATELAQPSAPARPQKSGPGSMTQVFDKDLVSDSVEVSESMLIDLPSADEGESAQLPTMELENGEFQPTPTLVIGIGGTAGSVLGQYRKRLINRFGEDGKLPALQLLLLDTDKRALLEATHSRGKPVLSSEETLSLPLRRPQEYRDRTSRLLSWLSRRWLYNIPKSLRTEGLRPLGRLAFADHARRTIQRIRLALSQAMDEHSIEQSNEQTGRNFRRQAIRVYVVASISGGTGSGMSIDLGYAVKSLLDKLGIENATTTGIFLHSTGRDSRYCDLSKVNAFSWFKEYHHFTRPEGVYPGDEASGLPAMPSGTPAFDHTYFLPLGDGLTPDQLEQSTDRVAQYLYLDSLTAAQEFFEANREATPELSSGSPALRTFGLHEESLTSPEVLAAVARQIGQRVVLGWSGENMESVPSLPETSDITLGEQETSSISETNQIICGAPRAVARLQLNLEGISANARSILEGQFGTDVEAMLSKLLTAAQLDSQEFDSADVLKVVDSLFAPAQGAENAGGKYVLGRRLDSIVSPLGMKLASDLQRWLLQRLDEQQERLAGTRLASDWFTKHFERVEVDAQRLAKGIGRQLIAIVDQVASGNVGQSLEVEGAGSDANLSLATKYFRLRLDHSALQATGHLVKMLLSELKAVGETIVEFGRHLRHLADSLDPQSANEASDIQCEAIAKDPLSQKLLHNLDALVTRVDQHLQVQFIHAQGGLFQTVMGSRKVMTELLDELKSLAEKEVALAARELCLAGGQTYEASELAKCASLASPQLMELGGLANQLAILPQSNLSGEQVARLRDALGNETSLLTGTEGNLTICTEAGQLPLARVAIDLIECRRDYAEFADRVHTRNDITFTPLTEVRISNPMAVSQFVTQVI